MKKLWDVGGFRAAIACQAAIESAFVLLLGLCASECSRSTRGQSRYLASALAAAIGTVLSLAYLSFRPVTAALTLLALIAWIVLRDRRLCQRSKLIWLTPFLTALAINIHFFAFFVPALFAALAIGDFFDNRRATTNAANRPRRNLLLLALTLIACCFTPMLPGVVQSVWHYSAQDVMVRSGSIAEFRPFYAGTIGHIVALFVAALLIIAAWKLLRPSPGEAPFSAGIFLWLLGSTALLFAMGRMSPVYAIAAAPVFAALFPGLSDRLLSRAPIISALAIVVLLAAVQIARALPGPHESFSAWLNRHGPQAPSYPCAAADFVEQNISPRTHHLLCDFTWGGFLEWRLGNRYQTLMDGRTQLFTADSWQNTALGPPSRRQQFLSRLQADAAIVHTAPNPLADELTALHWQTVYQDRFAKVMVKPPEPPAALSKTD